MICTIFYQDLIGIKKLVKSAPNFTIIFVDGRFIHWNDEILSNDGSREYILAQRNCILADAPDLIEWQKRNKYIEIAEKLGYEYCFVIDSDEYLIKYDVGKLEQDAYKYEQRYDSTSHFPYYRFHKSIARHTSRHQDIFINSKQIFSQDIPTLNVITQHDKTQRSEERQLYRLKYYNENPIR